MVCDDQFEQSYFSSVYDFNVVDTKSVIAVIFGH